MEEVIVKHVSTFRDGGTRCYYGIDNGKSYFVDRAILTKTPGAIYNDYPGRKNAIRLFNIRLKLADGEIIAEEAEINLNNPHNVKVGEQYWVRHIPSNGRWTLVKITRFTRDLTPWMEASGINGILSGKYYEVRPGVEIPDTEYKELYVKGLNILCDMNEQELIDFVTKNSHIINNQK